jgi:hypothetical protein
LNVVAGPTLDDEALRSQLRSVGNRSILHFANLEPHSFAGFRNMQVGAGWSVRGVHDLQRTELPLNARLVEGSSLQHVMHVLVTA